MSEEVTVSELPCCDFCNQEGINRKAHYDAATRMGPWANMCRSHFESMSIGLLGTGVGQRLVLRKDES